jgi:tRNA A-37 threonylcarbamoyl transferase component Bud32
MNKFRQVKSKSYEGMLLEESPLGGFLTANDLATLLQSATTIKDDHTRSIVSLTLDTGEKVFCKMYKERGLRAFIRRCLLGSRAKQSHARTVELSALKINTPQSLGFINCGESLLHVDSLHFCDLLDSPLTFSEALEQQASSAARVSLLESSVQLFKSLHDTKRIHGDTKLNNILLSDGRLYFVDLDGVKRFSKQVQPSRDVARFLVGLSEVSAVSIDERRQFFQNYCLQTKMNLKVFKSQVYPLVEKFQRRHKVKYNILAVEVL